MCDESSKMNLTFLGGASIIATYTGLAAIAILCIMFLYGLFTVLSSTRLRWALVLALHIPNSFRDLFRTEHDKLTPRRKAYLEVTPDHDAIVARVLDCMQVKNTMDVPSDVGKLLRLDDFFVSGFEKPYADGSRAPTKEERAILQLSKAIGVRRLQLSERSAAAYNLWQVTSIVSIGLGMLTTIVVSMSTTDFGRGETPTAVIVRLCAIILPALSTAAAAAFAFYGPQATWAQATRTLTSLAQLHGQMALDVWHLDSATDDAAKAKMAVALDGWSKRYLDIQTISAAATQGSPTQGSGGQTGGGQGREGGQQTDPKAAKI